MSEGLHTYRCEKQRHIKGDMTLAGETFRAGFLTCTTKTLLSDHDPEHSRAFYRKHRECSGFIRHIFVFKIINWEASRSQRLASKIKIFDILF